MSSFPKVLWNVEVPAAGWKFGFNDGVGRVVAVPGGTYLHPLDLCDELQTQLDASPSALDFTVTCSSIGTVAISANGAWTVTWASTTNALSTMLGFAETESVDGSNVLTATSQHHCGYYPGTISYGRSANRGAGLTQALVFRPTWPVSRSIAGSGAARIVGPVTPSEEAPFACSLITWDEYADEDIGVRAWLDECIAAQFYVYPDRADGTVAGWGAQNADYYLCTFRGDMRLRDGPHPDYLTYSVELHKEPVP